MLPFCSKSLWNKNHSEIAAITIDIKMLIVDIILSRLDQQKD